MSRTAPYHLIASLLAVTSLLLVVSLACGSEAVEESHTSCHFSASITVGGRRYAGNARTIAGERRCHGNIGARTIAADRCCQGNDGTGAVSGYRCRQGNNATGAVASER